MVNSEKFPIHVESPSQQDHNTWTAELAQMSSYSAGINGFFASMGLNVPNESSNDGRLQTALAFS